MIVKNLQHVDQTYFRSRWIIGGSNDEKDVIVQKGNVFKRQYKYL